MVDNRTEPPGVPTGLDEALARLAAAERALEQVQARELTLRTEMHHRIRNALAIVRSVFDRTSAGGGSLEDVSQHFQGRLDTLSRYQRLWADIGDERIDLESVVRDELRGFQFGDDARITLSGPDIDVDLQAGQFVALALHELVTNALKFGALLNKSGRLRIDWVRDDRHTTLTWEERGVPMLAPAPMRTGFGREFIEQALPYQLGAETLFEVRPGGVFCRILIPLEPARQR